MSKRAKGEKPPDVEFGIDWAEKAKKLGMSFIPTLHRHQYLAYKGGGNGRAYHRRERIRMLWPEYQFHRWNERRLKGFSDYDWLTWLGPASCLHGDSRIFDPITRLSPTVRQLCDDGISPTVMTLFGPRVAGVPFVKGYGKLLTVTLSNGHEFTASPEHRVLTQDGFRVLAEVSIGDVLAGAQPSVRPSEEDDYESHLEFSAGLRESISDTDLSVQTRDAYRCSKIVEDFQAGCSAYSHLCDEQLRPASGSDRSFPPLPVDALVDTACACADGDGSVRTLRGSRFGLSLPRPSTGRFSGQVDSLAEVCNRAFFSGTHEHDACGCQPRERFRSRFLRHPTEPKSFLDEQSRRLFCDNYARLRLDRSYAVWVHLTTVTAIRCHESDFYYDLEVPGAGHYFAEGAIHHNSAKSTDAAMFGLEYYTEAPDRTAVIICSTTVKMLRLRIWSQVSHYHQQLPQGFYAGELLDATTRIRWRKGDDKNGIFGMAVEEGSVEEVVNNLIGIHTERVLLILDEMQGIREAIMKATRNMIANPEFKLLGMGNPDGLQNPLGKESEPIGGWDSVTRGETEEWETHGGVSKGRGLCQFFDGRKSPADDSPEEKARLPWLCNREWFEGILKGAKGNMNDPVVWQMGIGWPPPTGLENTVLDDATITTFNCKKKAVWTEGYTRCAFLDPARTGGDKRMLVIGKRGRSSGVGYDEETRTWSTTVGHTQWIIEGEEWINVPIDINNKQRQIDYQIVDYVVAELVKRGIPPDEFSMFSTGAGAPLLSIFRTEWSLAVEGIEEGGSPSERIIPNQFNSDGTPKTAKDLYDTRSTELQLNVQEWARANGIRGLSDTAAFQYTTRRTFYRNGKWAVEPKVGSKGRKDEKGREVKGYKERMGGSPDEGDAFAGLVAHCMAKGAEPNVVGAAVTPTEEPYPQPQYDEYSSENYLRPYSFR
jgi:hypothetical protein